MVERELSDIRIQLDLRGVSKHTRTTNIKEEKFSHLSYIFVILVFYIFFFIDFLVRWVSIYTGRSNDFVYFTFLFSQIHFLGKSSKSLNNEAIAVSEINLFAGAQIEAHAESIFIS